MILKSAVRRCCKDWIWNAMPVCVCCGLYQALCVSVCGGGCVCGWVVYKNDHVVKPGCQGRCDAVCLIGNVGIVIFCCTLSRNVLISSFFPLFSRCPPVHCVSVGWDQEAWSSWNISHYQHFRMHWNGWEKLAWINQSDWNVIQLDKKLLENEAKTRGSITLLKQQIKPNPTDKNTQNHIYVRLRVCVWVGVWIYVRMHRWSGL